MGTTAPGCSVIEELVSADITIDDVFCRWYTRG